MNNTELTNTTGGMDKLITVKQLPVIEAQLKEKAVEIKAKTELACSMACTPETLSTVKQMRADLNNEFKQYEAARKRVKTAIMAPYDDFEAVYKECIANSFTNADKQLGQMVNSVSYHLREEKEKGIREYFYEHLEASGLERDEFAFERMGLSVNLSQSVSSLKKACKSWIEDRAKDMATIKGMANADEIMAEYLRNLDLSRAILLVNDRHKDIAAVKAQREAREQAEAKVMPVHTEEESPVVEALAAPEIVTAPQETEEEILELSFKVWGSREKLKALKAFLIEGGYRYE